MAKSRARASKGQASNRTVAERRRAAPAQRSWIKVTSENCCELFADKVNITIRIHEACTFHGFTVHVLMNSTCGIKDVETIISISEPDGSGDWAISLKENYLNCPKERNCYYGAGPATPMSSWNWKGHKTDGKYIGKLPGGIKSLWGTTVKVHVKANSCCASESEKDGAISWN